MGHLSIGWPNRIKRTSAGHLQFAIEQSGYQDAGFIMLKVVFIRCDLRYVGAQNKK